MKIRVARSRTADLDQHLPRPRFWHRYLPKLARLLPFHELEGLHPSGRPNRRRFARLDPNRRRFARLDDPVELDLEMQRPAEDLVLPVGRRIDDQPRVLDAPQERLQRDVDLQTRQW